MKNLIVSGFVGAFYLLFFVGSANAEIYKCVNSTGATVYHDKPCSIKEKETQIKAVKDPTNGYIPPAFVNDDVIGEENNLRNRGLKEGKDLKGRSERPISPLAQMKKDAEQNKNRANKKTKNSSDNSSATDAQKTINEKGLANRSSKTDAERQMESEIAKNPQKYTTH